MAPLHRILALIHLQSDGTWRPEVLATFSGIGLYTSTGVPTTWTMNSVGFDDPDPNYGETFNAMGGPTC